MQAGDYRSRLSPGLPRGAGASSSIIIGVIVKSKSIIPANIKLLPVLSESYQFRLVAQRARLRTARSVLRHSWGVGSLGVVFRKVHSH